VKKIPLCLGITAFIGRRFPQPARIDWRPKWPPYKGLIAAIALAGSIFFGACGLMRPTGEQVQQQPRKTVYKSADETESDQPNLPPVQKVPGE
jgi:hypothetical protein